MNTSLRVEPSPHPPIERLQTALKTDLDRVGALIRARMASDHAPRIPEVTAHLVEAGESAFARC